MAAGRAPPGSVALLFVSTLRLFALAPTLVCAEGEAAAGVNQVVDMLQQQHPHHHHHHPPGRQQQQQQQAMAERGVGGGTPHLVAYAGKLLQVEVKTMLLTLGADSQLVNVQDLPPWLLYDEGRGELVGVPTPRHLGQTAFTLISPCRPTGGAACQPVAHVVTVAVHSPPPSMPPNHSFSSPSDTSGTSSTSHVSATLESAEPPAVLLNAVGERVPSTWSSGSQDRTARRTANSGELSGRPSSHSTPDRRGAETFNSELAEPEAAAAPPSGTTTRSDLPAGKASSLATPHEGPETPPASTTASQDAKQCPSHHVASLVLCSPPDGLNASVRVHVVQKAADFLSVAPSSLTWLASGDGRLRMLGEGYRVESGGAAEGGGCLEAVNSELFWPLSCSAGRHVGEFTRILQHNVLVGRIQREVGAQVVGWYVASKETEPRGSRRRRRRRAGGGTPVPTPTLYPPSATPVSSSSSAPAASLPSVEFTVATAPSSTREAFGFEPTPSVVEAVPATASAVSQDRTASEIDTVGLPFKTSASGAAGVTALAHELASSTLQPSVVTVSGSHVSVFSASSLSASPTPALFPVESRGASGAATRGAPPSSSADSIFPEPSGGVLVPELSFRSSWERRAGSVSQRAGSHSSPQIPASTQRPDSPVHAQDPSPIDTAPAPSQPSPSPAGFASVSRTLPPSLVATPSASSTIQNVPPLMPAAVGPPEVLGTAFPAAVPASDSSGVSASELSASTPGLSVSASGLSRERSESGMTASPSPAENTATEIQSMFVSSMTHMTRSSTVASYRFDRSEFVVSPSSVPSEINPKHSSEPDRTTVSSFGEGAVVVAGSSQRTVIETELYPSLSLHIQASASPDIVPPPHTPDGPNSSPTPRTDTGTEQVSSSQVEGVAGVSVMSSSAAPSVFSPSLPLTPSLRSRPVGTAVVNTADTLGHRGTTAFAWPAATSGTAASSSQRTALGVHTEMFASPVHPPAALGTDSAVVISAPSVQGTASSRLEPSVDIRPSRTVPAVGATPASSDDGRLASSGDARSSAVRGVADSSVTLTAVSLDVDERASLATPRSGATLATAGLVSSTAASAVVGVVASDVITSAAGGGVIEATPSAVVSSLSVSFSASVPGPTPVSVAATASGPPVAATTTTLGGIASSATPAETTTTTTTPAETTTTTTSPADATTTTATTTPAEATTTTTTPAETTTTTSTTPAETTTAAPPTTTTATTRVLTTTPWWWTTGSSSRQTESVQPVSVTTTRITAVSIDTPNNPPFLVNSLSYLTTVLGRYFEKPIPHDMFYDVEDGSTPSLTLTVTLPYDQPLPPNFWVQFDSRRQVLMGLPLVADLDMGYHSVVVVATDSQGLGASNPINLYVNSSAFVHFTHRFVMKFGVEFGQFMRRRDNVMTLLKKIGSYYGDGSAQFVTVVDVSTGSFVLSWTNSSLSGSTCQNKTIHAILNRMVRRDGSIRSAFNRHIGKKLRLQQITYQPDGACLYRVPLPTTTTTTLATDASAKGGSELDLLTEIILPVLIALLLVLLIFIIALFVYRCRQQRGTIETLDKDLYAADRSPVILPNEIPNVDVYNARPKKPMILPFEEDRHTSSFPRNRPRTYEHYRQSGSLSRDRPNSYTFDDERPSARPVTVIFNNFDSIPRQSRPPSYWNDNNEETPPNIRVPPPYMSTTSV